MGYDPLTEVLDRVRRIETRTTIIGRHLGADVGGGKPEWHNGTVHAPTANCSLAELMKVVPPDWRGTWSVYVNDEPLFTGRLTQ
jgi:hypothetical protein